MLRFGYLVSLSCCPSFTLRITEIEHILETYELSDIIERNDLTEADVLLYLVEQEFLDLPDPEPLDFD